MFPLQSRDPALDTTRHDVTAMAEHYISTVQGPVGSTAPASAHRIGQATRRFFRRIGFPWLAKP